MAKALPTCNKHRTQNETFTDIHTEINPLIINLNDDSSTSSSESEENHYSDSTE
jgi:hypothetical protein